MKILPFKKQNFLTSKINKNVEVIIVRLPQDEYLPNRKFDKTQEKETHTHTT